MSRPAPALLLALLPAALLAAACGRSAALPRTVPDEATLPAGQRKAYLKAVARAAEGDAAGAERALAPLLLLRPIHVPSHLLHQDLSRSTVPAEDLAKEYIALSRSLPGDASADVLVTRAVHAGADARIAGYQAAAVKDARAPWPRIALATERADLARELVRRAAARELDGFAEEGGKLRAEAKRSLERARTEGQNAVEVAPGLAAAHAALGHVLSVTASLMPLEEKEKRDLRSRAIERLGMALAIDPGDPWILASRGFVLQEAGRGGDAQADFDAAAASAPGDPAILAARARNLEGISLPDRAAAAWKEAVEAAPGEPGVLVDYGSSLARLGRWQEALEAYRRADALYAARGGERWKARRGLVTALAQRGLDAKDGRSIAEALECLKAYRTEGGPDVAWASKMAEVLGEEAPAPAPPSR